MKIRKYVISDSSELQKLFYETIHLVNSSDYSQIQLNTWVPEKKGMQEFEKYITKSKIKLLLIKSVDYSQKPVLPFVPFLKKWDSVLQGSKL